MLTSKPSVHNEISRKLSGLKSDDRVKEITQMLLLS
jgi:hypothetical protein